MALPRINLHELLLGELREMIGRGELQPGTKIPETELCARFDVSRTPLREALKVLAAEGLLELRPRRGAVVASVTHEEIDELFPIMAMLEGLAGELLCARIDMSGIALLRGIHDAMMADFIQRDEPAYLRGNRHFHETLFALAGNATLQQMYGQILCRIRACRFVVHKSEAAWHRAIGEHDAIMEAITTRDGPRLSCLLREHVTGVTVEIAREALDRALIGVKPTAEGA